MDEEYAPIPSLLALSAVHNHLIREKTRNQVALIVESGEPREVMHFALLLGYGASAVNPYLAIETLEDLHTQRRVSRRLHVGQSFQELHEGHRQGAAEDIFEDGHFHAAKLSGRADFRGHRPEPSAGGALFHRHVLAHRGRGHGSAGARSADEAPIRDAAIRASRTPSCASAANISIACAASGTC